MFGVTILGNNSAIPAHGRHPTAQIITTGDDLLLFDCGEGTQIQILNYKIRRSRINHIFISHLHGDHYFGLIGLLSSFALLSRIQPLHVYGPAPLKGLLDQQFLLSETHITFPFHFHAIEQDGLLLDAPHYTVSCFSTKHRIECRGFVVRQKKRKRKILRNLIEQKNIALDQYALLQDGQDITLEDGTVIPNESLTIAATRPKSYAFTADTLFDPAIIPHVKGVDLLYHEATYPHALVDKAAERYHSTTKEAAEIARQAEVNKLLIGHFSAKFDNITLFEEEAKEVFPNAEAAMEGVTYIV
jgi:ribonuclease Z